MGNELIPVSGADYTAYESSEAPSGAASPPLVKKFLGSLKKFWWIPLLTLAVGIAAGFALVRRMEPVYISKASMWETSKLRLPDQSIYSDDMENILGTQIEILQSDKLRKLALERLGSMSNSVPLPTGLDGQPLAVDIRVSIVPKSSIFQIQAISANPVFTKNYLDALMQSFLDYDKEVRNNISGVTLASINDQMQGLEQDLKVEQDALMAYELTNNIGVLQQEQSVAGEYLAKLRTQLSDLELEGELLQTAEDDSKHDTNGTIPLDVIEGITPSAASGPASQTQDNATSLELMKKERDDLAKYLQPQSQKLLDLDEQIKQAEDLEQITHRRAAGQLDAAVQANQIKTKYVKDSINEWQTKVAEADTRLGAVDHLKLNIQRTQSSHDRLSALAQNLELSRSIDQESLAILEAASAPYRSTQEEKQRLGMAGFGGFAAGLALVLLLGMRDDRFTSITEVNSALGDTVVGMLPKVTQEASGQPRLLQKDDERHIYAESYRSLRSALRFLETGENHPKVLLITSATPNEGKSTVAANLAHTLAMAGSRVLLVDCDLRRGHLHRLLGLRNETGLTELLSGSCAMEQVIQTNSIPNLWFIARGKSDGNPGDLLMSPRFDEYLARWRREYDYVLVDSSPVFAAADAGSLAPRVDGTLFLVRSHYSSAKVTREALEQLVQRRGKILGVVFNMVDTTSRKHYHYKYAEYYPDAKAE